MHARSRRCWAWLISFSLSIGTVGAQVRLPTPVLLELFTAEGCSSCPPADEFLRQIDAAQPIADAHLIVLSEHVDYWDHQGWPDRFASSAITHRQVEYDRALRIREPFTPQLIVDGNSDLRLTDRARIEPLLEGAATSAKVPVTLESVRVDPGSPAQLAGSIAVDASTAPHRSELLLALAIDHATSSVLRGENRGRSLTHVAILRELVKLGSVEPGAPVRRDFKIALSPELAATELRVVALLQDSGPGAVRGAAESRIHP